LSASGLRKDFGGVHALKDVSLNVSSGEIVGLIGPNGAGKTTLVNILSGILVPDLGEIYVDDTSLSGMKPFQIARLGVARTFQNIRLYRSLTVAENLEVSYISSRQHRRPGKENSCAAILTRLGLESVANRIAGTLPYGHQRRVEIGRALALDPDFLLLDEPAAGANAVETRTLVEMVGEIREIDGCGVLVIDHDLQFIMTACDRIYVLDDGSLLAEGTPQQIQGNEEVIRVYLGGSDQTSRLPRRDG
jgi:branched-chain amino acid transport system ATP-binding protein